VTMTLTTDSLDVLRECFEDFVRGSGFVVKEEVAAKEELDDWEYDEAEREVIPMPDLKENLSFLNKYLRTEYEEH